MSTQKPILPWVEYKMPGNRDNDAFMVIFIEECDGQGKTIKEHWRIIYRWIDDDGVVTWEPENIDFWSITKEECIAEAEMLIKMYGEEGRDAAP